MDIVIQVNMHKIMLYVHGNRISSSLTIKHHTSDRNFHSYNDHLQGEQLSMKNLESYDRFRRNHY